MRFFKRLFKGNKKKAKDDDRRDEYLEENDRPEKAEKPARAKRPRKDFRDTKRKIHLLIPIGISVVALFLFISLLSKNADGLIGPVGKAFGDVTFGLFGFAAYFLPPILILRAVRWRSDVREKNALFAGILSFFFLIFIGIISYFAVSDVQTDGFRASAFYQSGVSRRGGGFFGNALAYGLRATIGPVGAILFCVLVFGLFLLFATGIDFRRVWAFCRAFLQKQRARRALERAKAKEAAEKPAAPVRPSAPARAAQPAPIRRQVYDIFDETLFPEETPSLSAGRDTDTPSLYDPDRDLSLNAIPLIEDEPELIEDKDFLSGLPIPNGDNEPLANTKNTFDLSAFDTVEEIGDEPSHSFEELSKIMTVEEPVSEPQVIEEAPVETIKTTRTKLRYEEVEPAPIERRHTDDGSILAGAVKLGAIPADGRAAGELPDEEAKNAKAAAPSKKPTTKYKAPPLDMLDMPVYNADAVSDDEIRANADTLIRTLATFGVGARVVAYEKGPRITRYEIKPDDGTRVRAITNLAEEISMSLACDGIRIERIRDVIGVEVPNRNSQSVYLRSLVDRDEFKKAGSKTTVCLGCDVTGKPMYTDIAKAPHLLIAGATGMGKSVCINTLITSILYKATPDEVRLILVDPKKVEFTPYRTIPHLLVPVVTDPNQAAGALEWAVNEMERRFEILSEAGVPNTLEYNEGIKDDPEREYMPTVVIIIDEFNDLLMTASDSVEKSVLRIAQKARAAGMHLIIGTQRPDRNVINSTIKANIPVRIAFKVAQQVNSQVILDQGGAERLLDKGDMLAILPGKTTPIRMQGAFVSSKEIKRVTEYLQEHSGGQVFDDAVLAEINENARKLAHAEDGEEDDTTLEKKADPKFEEAVEVAFRRGSISTSLLQRELEIGFGRGARIIDRMYKMGIVGESEGGAKPRKLLISRGEYLEMKYQQEQRAEKSARKKEDEDDDY